MFCADFFKVSLFFESFEEDLEQEIYSRKENKEYFSEVELWYIFDSIVSIGAFLQENKIYHGDIRPFNIFITASKDYKICDTGLFRTTAPAWLADGLESKSHYPSPQYFKGLDFEANNVEYDRAKNDVFSLGMTMLETALLEKPEGVYDWDTYTVNAARVEELITQLSQVKEKYSETLIQTIRFTLNFNEAERPDFITLDRELAPYRNDIRARISTTQQATALPERLSVPYEDELDRRVRAALRRSEETIARSSPTKYKNPAVDAFIHSYLNNEPIVYDEALFKAITPYLTSDNKYTMTLNQYPEEGANATNTNDTLRNAYLPQPVENKDYTTSVYNYQPITQPVATGNVENTQQADLTKPYNLTGINTVGTTTYDVNAYKLPETTTNPVNTYQPIDTAALLSQINLTTPYIAGNTQNTQPVVQPTSTQVYQTPTYGVESNTAGTTNIGTYNYNAGTSTVGTNEVGGTYNYTAPTNYSSFNADDILKQVAETLKKSQVTGQV